MQLGQMSSRRINIFARELECDINDDGDYDDVMYNDANSMSYFLLLSIILNCSIYLLQS